MLGTISFRKNITGWNLLQKVKCPFYCFYLQLKSHWWNSQTASPLTLESLSRDFLIASKNEFKVNPFACLTRPKDLSHSFSRSAQLLFLTDSHFQVSLLSWQWFTSGAESINKPQVQYHFLKKTLKSFPADWNVGQGSVEDPLKMLIIKLCKWLCVAWKTKFL